MVTKLTCFINLIKVLKSSSYKSVIDLSINCHNAIERGKERIRHRDIYKKKSWERDRDRDVICV